MEEPHFPVLSEKRDHGGAHVSNTHSMLRGSLLNQLQIKNLRNKIVCVLTMYRLSLFLQGVRLTTVYTVYMRSGFVHRLEMRTVIGRWA